MQRHSYGLRDFYFPIPFMTTLHRADHIILRINIFYLENEICFR